MYGTLPVAAAGAAEPLSVLAAVDATEGWPVLSFIAVCDTFNAYAMTRAPCDFGRLGVCWLPASPASTTRYSLPSTLYAEIGATIAEPVSSCQSSRPVFVSRA